MAATQCLAHPGEVVADDEIPKRLSVERRRRRNGLGRNVIELPERRKAIDHVFPICLQARPRQLETGLGRVRFGAGQCVEQTVANQRPVFAPGGNARSVVVDLFEQYRREIDDGAHARHRLEMGQHVGIILDAVQIGPWQQIVAVNGVTILRLVHMPAEDDAQSGRCNLQCLRAYAHRRARHRLPCA